MAAARPRRSSPRPRAYGRRRPPGGGTRRRDLSGGRRTCLKVTSEREAQLVVRERLGDVLVETRDPHAQKAHGAARIEPPEQLEGDLADRAHVVYGGVDAARAGDGAEVVEAHLDADRTAAALLAGERLAQLAGELVKHRLERLEAAQIAVEGRLARLRLRPPDGLDRAVVLEAGQRREVGAEPGAEPPGELLVGRGAQAAERRDAELLQLGHGLGADAGHEA